MRRCLLAMICATAAAPAAAENFYHDFRKGPLPDKFALHQVKTDEFVKAEAAGLRIQVPTDFKHPFGGIGVRTTFGVGGDFEITTTAELVEADAPPAGAYGVGVTLRIEKAEPSPDFINLARMVRNGDKHIVLWEESIGPMNENRKIRAGAAPCPDKTVKLRMKRTGTTLQMSWAPAAPAGADDFQEIKSLEFGADDIKRISLIGYNSRQPPLKLNALFRDLRVTSPDPAVAAPVADAPVGNAGPTTESGRRLWWLLAGGIGAVVALLVLFLVARSKRAGSAEASSAASGTAPAQVELQCPNCQKRLKVSAAAAGKKVKCPACATAFAS
jgi:predicted Zn finger-like uncharacterized protein